MLSRFHQIPERDRQMDGQTDRIAISISHVSVLTHNKNSVNTTDRTFQCSCLNTTVIHKTVIQHVLCSLPIRRSYNIQHEITGS